MGTEGDSPLTGLPPPFGHRALELFAFNSNYINLNHGSFGSVPLHVTASANALGSRIEANPDHFLRLEYEPAWNKTRSRLARMIGASADECVIVPNVATGINTVLRNFQWSAGDTIIITNLAYDSILRAVQNICDTAPNPTISYFDIHLPQSHSEILVQWKRHIKAIKEQRAGTSKIVANFDSISAGPAVVLPWREMVAICTTEGVFSVVDAAHSLGQEGNIRLDLVQPDFWIASCSKWLYAKRASAILYVPKRNQHIIKSALPTSAYHPSPSTGEVNTFITRFCFPGTLDVTVPLSVNAALDFREWLGGEDNINAYCHRLALEGGKRLAEVLGTSMMEVSEEQIANMVNVELPLPSFVAPSVSIHLTFQRSLLEKNSIYATQFYHNGRWWTRACAQIFNEISDFEKLGNALLNICKEIARDSV